MVDGELADREHDRSHQDTDDLVLQILYPFELYSQHCGSSALAVHWEGDTFEGGRYSGVRVLDVAATLDARGKRVALFIVNRTQEQPSEVQITLETGRFNGRAEMIVINGADIKSANTFEAPENVTAKSASLSSPARVCRSLWSRILSAMRFEIN